MITYKPMNNYRSIAGTSNTGLCNQMFQVASTVGIALRNSHKWCVPEWVHPFKEMPTCRKWYRTVKVPWEYENVRVKDNRALKGYMQSEKYFDHCAGLIRQLFTFKEELVVCNDFISVHVRRGDYRWANYNMLGREYYDRALSLLPDLPIYVFTDDPEAAKKAVPAYDKIFSGDPFYDLNLMTYAKYAVIANSSFSWWGAWLSNASVISPAEWFGPASRYDAKDIYCKDWEVI